MTSYGLLLLAIFGFIGAMLGAFAVPGLSNLLLRRSHVRSCKWFSDMSNEYERFMAGRESGQLSVCTSGLTSAVSMWLVDVKRAISAGTLTKEQAVRLREVGIECNGDSKFLSQAQQLSSYTKVMPLLKRISIATVLAVVCAMPLVLGFSVSMTVLLLPCWLSAALSIVCDVRSRIIPLECCIALGAFGAVFQLLSVGLRGLLIGVFAAAVVVIVCTLANKLLSKRTSPVGLGDIRLMVALCLTCGNGVLSGALACYVSAAVFSAAAVACRKLKLTDGVPMAPFLTIWLLFGVCFTR